MTPNRACLYLAFLLIAAVAASAPLGAQATGPAPERLRIVDSTKIQVITMRDGSSLGLPLNLS